MDYIDEIKVSPDEHYVHLELTGDFVETFEEYLKDEDAIKITLLLTYTDAMQLRRQLIDNVF